MHPAIKLLRPAQWAKNAFVLAPMFFSGNLLNMSMWAAEAVCFISFCLISSAVYCINDIVDADADRTHPDKRRRPIASGQVSTRAALATAAGLATASIGITAALIPGHSLCTVIIVAYLLLNIAYSLLLKHIAILDVSIIAAGFVLRVTMGAEAADIWLSPWIVAMVFLLALTLGFGKRRHDTALAGCGGRKSRYRTDRLTTIIRVLCGITIATYALYSLSPDVEARFHTDRLYLTAFFVAAGLIRFMKLAITDNNAGDPTSLLFNDRPLQLCIAGWVISFILIIYA